MRVRGMSCPLRIHGCGFATWLWIMLGYLCGIVLRVTSMAVVWRVVVIRLSPLRVLIRLVCPRRIVVYLRVLLLVDIGPRIVGLLILGFILAVVVVVLQIRTPRICSGFVPVLLRLLSQRYEPPNI